MRKHKMYLTVFIVFFASFSHAQNNPVIAPYAEYIQTQKKSGKEYILDLFKTNDIVILCERLHPEFTQYEFLMDVISDKRFVNEVGNIFTEVGVSNLNPSLNTFLHRKNLSKEQQLEQVLHFRRDLMWTALWEPTNYTYLLESLYSLNNKLADKDAINLYPSDIPCDWKLADSTYLTTSVVPLIKDRDSVIASQIIQQFDRIKFSTSKHKKALVIMNYRHAFNNNFYTHDGKQINNVALFLFRHYGNKVANVLLNSNGWDKKDNALLLQQGKWDAAFAATGNKCTGFNFQNTPFGKDSFDLWVPGNGGFTYQNVFTGFVFYNPVEAQRIVTGIPGFLDSTFLDEFFRRFRLTKFVPTNMKQFTEEEIAKLKMNPQDFERDINEKKERPLPGIDDLIKMRNGWLR